MASSSRPHAEVRDRRAEQHRRGLRGQERGGVVLAGHLVQQLQLLDGRGPAGQARHQLVGDGDPVLGCRLGAAGGAGEADQLLRAAPVDQPLHVARRCPPAT